ncbi:retention module-containing protein, partial [Pseudomonas sp. BF-RE-03]|uniref:retention module-containing protein n=1 Tax=Pseudomonas sp. BF-RE-03 TaxID=2832359 RepID=UPI001CBBD58F
MATLIGIVSKVIGQVFAQGSDGTRRVLIEGDRLFAGDQLITGAEGAVAVHLQNGQELTLGRGSSLQMNPQLLVDHASHVNTPEATTPTQAQLSDVERVQKAIAAGDDPTQTAEATAAGPGTPGAPGGALGGGHSFVLLEEVAGRVDPTVGFPTAGFNGVPEFPRERLAGDPDAGDPDNGGNATAAPIVADTPDRPDIPDTPDNPDNPVTLDGLDVEGGELTVYEKNLTYGTDPDAPALTQSGTFTVTALDGLLTLTVGGIAVVTAGVAAGFPQSSETDTGAIFTITGYNPATGVVSYSYTLRYDSDHPNPGGADSISEHFDVVAKDVDGSTATGQINVNIVDDTPNASPDATSVVEGGTVSGNVLWNDVAGADGPLLGGGVVGVRAGSDTSTPVNGGLNTHINGTYGYLTLDAQGNAEYHSYPNGVSGPGATDVFTYTLRDNDGDESTTTITIDVTNGCISPVTLSGLDAYGGELTVYEKNLTYGTDPDAPALTQTGTFNVNAPDGLLTLTVGGIAVVTAGVAAGFPQSSETDTGAIFTITGYNPATGVVSYSYTLRYDSDHPNPGGADSISEHFDVVAKDVDGSTATGQINVNIVDDTPNASPDATSVVEGGTVSGNVLWNDVAGADGPLLGGGVVGVRAGSDTSTPVNGGLNTHINGTYGYLTLDAQGNAEYHSYPNGVSGPGATDVFTYTLRDNDGDESTTTITIDVTNGCISPVTLSGLDAYGGELTVYEKNLTYGTDPDAPALTQTGTFNVNA